MQPISIVIQNPLYEKLKPHVPPVPPQPEECIICLEPNNVIPNKICACKYTYHAECLMKVNNPAMCILCKKEAAPQLEHEHNPNDACIHNLNIFLSGLSCIICIILFLVFCIIWK